MRYNEILDEGIEDKGKFKAVFFAGLPGSGKSTVAKRITDGTIHPRYVNTDKTYEFLTKKSGLESSNLTWTLFGPRSMVLNKQMLKHYLNGMLPLFIDGTSSNSSSMLRRSGLLESIGYDTMMIWVSTSLETSINRAQARERQVDEDYIKEVYAVAEANKKFYQQRFGSSFIEVDNNADNFNNMEMHAYGVASKFFTSPINNPIGVRTEEQLRETGDKYLTPTIHSEDYISKMVGIWYM